MIACIGAKESDFIDEQVGNDLDIHTALYDNTQQACENEMLRFSECMKSRTKDQKCESWRGAAGRWGAVVAGIGKTRSSLLSGVTKRMAGCGTQEGASWIEQRRNSSELQ